MPLPKPSAGQTKDEFIEQCMADDVMNDEYPDAKQRFAICNSQWNKKKENNNMGKKQDIEFRVVNLDSLEVRTQEGKRPMLTGYAAVFNKLSDIIIGSFREKIDPHAFDETLEEDIRCLLNHDPNFVLGRTKSSTLRLAVDDTGLRIECDPPETQWANDLLVTVGRRDIDQMSFAFECIEDEWDKTPKMPVRTLKKVRLFDVSPVTSPAYPQTKVGLRGLTEDELVHALDRYFQPESKSDSHAPQELTEGRGEIQRYRQAFLKLR